MGFFGEAPHGINYTPYFPPIINGGMYLSLQYSLSGYLAPDSRLQFSSAVSVGNAFFSNAYGQLQSLVTLTDPGYFELNYQEVVPFNDGFRVDVPATGFYQMFYELHVTLDAKPGSGESWVVLDPGAGTGVQGSNLFPWLPDASPVPEPPSWLLSLTAIVGLPWLRRARRVRGEAAPLTAPSAISAAGGRADASSART
jgi:hypothetical protein